MSTPGAAFDYNEPLLETALTQLPHGTHTVFVALLFLGILCCVLSYCSTIGHMMNQMIIHMLTLMMTQMKLSSRVNIRIEPGVVDCDVYHSVF